MQERQIELTFDGREGGMVARLAIANEHRLNSMNSPLMDEFVKTVKGLAARQDLRALVVTGAGDKAFIGGADIKEMGAIALPSDARFFITGVHLCCQALRDLPVPVIARINGFCFGAGLELAAACDLRIAAHNAVVGMPEVRLGIPSVIEAALLPGLIGWARTRRLLLLAENLEADEALAWGLVDRVAAPEGLDAAVDEWIDLILASPPGAIRLQKALIRKWEDLPLSQAIEAGIDSFAAAYETDEPARAMGEFLARQAARKKR